MRYYRWRSGGYVSDDEVSNEVRYESSADFYDDGYYPPSYVGPRSRRGCATNVGLSYTRSVASNGLSDAAARGPRHPALTSTAG